MVVYLSFNHVFPAYEGMELGIGDALLIKAVVEATGRTKAAVEAAYKTVGDLGLVALQSRTNQGTLGFAVKPKPLTARAVLTELRNITQTKGNESMSRKVGIIKKLMISCQGMEAKYLIRALQGKLRIGLAAQTVLVSLAQAFIYSAKSLSIYPSSSSLVSDKTDGQLGKRADRASDNSESEQEEEADEDAPQSRGAAGKRRRVVDDDDAESGEDEAAGGARAVQGLKMVPASGVSPVSVSEAPVSVSEAPVSAGAVADSLISDTSCSSPVELLRALVRHREPDEARQLRLAMSGAKELKPSHSDYRSLPQMCELAVIAVKRAFSECPNISLLVSALLKRPIYELFEECRLVPGVPVAPMLAKPSKQVAEVLRRLSGQMFTMEYKYDGERAQVHLLPDGTVKIFSRNSEDNSQKYPDLMDVVRYHYSPS